MNTAMGFPGALAACALLFAGCSSTPDSPSGQGDALHLSGASGARAVAAVCGGGGGIACASECHDGGTTADAGSADDAPAGGEPGDAGAADSSTDGEPPAQYRTCQSDDDCVAVALAGCCNNGWKTAVNHSEADAYAEAFACHREHPICPLYIVNDTRVAECDHAAQLCGMVAIEDIVCGGFIAHPHGCPDGYHCALGRIPDVGGHCVSDDGN